MAALPDGPSRQCSIQQISTDAQSAPCLSLTKAINENGEFPASPGVEDDGSDVRLSHADLLPDDATEQL